MPGHRDSQFRHFTSPESTRNLTRWDHGLVDLESITCPINEGHQHPGKRLSDLSVVLPHIRVDDIVWTWYSECLIETHVLEKLREEQITGFAVRPVHVRFSRQTAVPPPALWELVVTGWGGLASPDSGIRLIRHCSSCGSRVYSAFDHSEHLVDPAQWDGSDFFIVWPLPRFIFVSDRVVSLLRRERWRGFRLLDPASLTVEGRTLSPGRLSYFMPDARAHILGDPLGIY